MTVSSRIVVLTTAFRRSPLSAVVDLPIAMLRSPLTRNGYALVLNAALTSALGFLFWILAARLYTAEQVGLGAAMLNMLLIIGNTAQFNLGNVLNRFLPVAGTRTSKLILFSYGVGVAAAFFISACFVLVVGIFAPSLGFLSQDPWVSCWFVAASAAWTLFALQDCALAGMRQSAWIPLENAVYAISKIGLLVFLAGTAPMGSGIFAAWITPLPVIIVGINLFIFFRLIAHNSPNFEPIADINMPGLLRFFGWDYLGNVALILALGGAPLMVLNVVGPAATASYQLAWTISYSLYLIGRSMGISLLAESAADQDRIDTLTSDTFVHSVILLTVALLIVFAGAPLIMSLFGPYYVKEGVGLLRVLALSSMVWSLVTIYLAVARARGDLVMVAIVQIATLILALGLGAPFLYLMGAFGMGLAWLVTHATVAGGILIYFLIKDGPGHVIDWSLSLASSVSRLTSVLLQHKRASPGKIVLEPAVQALLRDTGEPEVASWRPLRIVPSQSDVLTIYLGPLQQAPAGILSGGSPNSARALFKTSSSVLGANSLDRYVMKIQCLRADTRLTGCNFRLPEVLAFKNTTDGVHLIERVLPGEDGRVALLRPGTRVAALAAAARAMANTHYLTAESAVIGRKWLNEWIDQPASLLAKSVSTLMTVEQRREAIGVFVDEQHAFWRDQDVWLGLGHGDFSPGNILFAPADGHDQKARTTAARPAVAEITVSAIIDWERASQNAPPGFDACHLALTSRTLVSGQEIGQVVRSILLNPQWTPQEEVWLAGLDEPNANLAGWPRDPRTVYAITGLAWLHHVAANIEKSSRYAHSRLWTAWNIERVLQTYLLKSATGSV